MIASVRRKGRQYILILGEDSGLKPGDIVLASIGVVRIRRRVSIDRRLKRLVIYLPIACNPIWEEMVDKDIQVTIQKAN